MVVLRILPALPALLWAACYSPDIPDCARSGECQPGTLVDAGHDGRADARPDAAPDAPPPTVTVVVRIDGRGDVSIPNVGTCSAGNGTAECPFAVVKGVTLSLVAQPKNGWELARWEDACANTSGATCTITPLQAMTSVRARFDED